MPEFRTDYALVQVDADYLAKAVKPKQFIHIDQSECIMCEGCVDICPWKCIHMVQPQSIAEATGTELPGVDPSDNVVFLIDDDVCALRPVRGPVPHRRHHLGQGRRSGRQRRRAPAHQHPRLRLRDEARMNASLPAAGPQNREQ